MAKKKPKVAVEVTSGIEEITLADAKRILEDQGMNRPLKMSKVRQIADQIAAGDWVLNGEAIVFDEDEKLLDGQHRIKALQFAGERHNFTGSLKSVVVRGIPRSLFHTFDQGEKRSLADVVAMDNIKNAAEVAVACRLLKIRLSGKKVSGAGRMIHSDSLDLLHEHANLADWVDYVMTAHEGEDEWLPVRSMVSVGYLGALAYIASLNYESTKVEDFIKALCNQENTNKACAAFLLRKVLLANRSDTKGKLKRDALVALIVKAMRAYLDESTIAKLSLRGNEYPVFDSEGPQESDPDSEE